MADSIVVMPGSARLDFSPIAKVAGEFGWNVRIDSQGSETQRGAPDRDTMAVLLCRDAFGPGVSWREAITLLRITVPDAPVIALHGFAESMDWTELSEAGAYHSLWLPLKKNEVRQSLGFLSSAKNRPLVLSGWGSDIRLRAMSAGSLAA